MTTVDKELKRKVTERWNIISRGQRFNPFPVGRESTAFAQLEYILIEAGLLAQKRKRISPDSEVHAISVAETKAAKAEGDKPPTLSRSGVGDALEIEDNTIGLSEEVGRNYSE